MPALDFPNTPGLGDQFPTPPIPGIPTWVWDGIKWKPLGGTGGSTIFVGPLPPFGAPVNSLWWNNQTGRLFIYYDDGSSTQWVEIGPLDRETTGLEVHVGSLPPQQPNELGQLWWNIDQQQMFFWDGVSNSWNPMTPTIQNAVPEAPTDGNVYGRRNEDWTQVAQGPGLNEDAPPDGQGYIRRNGVWIPVTVVRGMLSATVMFTVANTFYDGPQCNVGSEGTWLVTSIVTLLDSSSATDFIAKLWDGYATIADASMTTPGAQYGSNISLSGVITDPLGPIRVSAMSINRTNTSRFSVNANVGRPTTDNWITAVRIG